MYTTIIHPLRVHLHLSLVEYVVLDTIYNLQNSERFDFWCVMSQQEISRRSGIPLRTVQAAYKKLLELDYIKKKHPTGDTAVRVTQNTCDVFNHHKEVEGFAIRGDGMSITYPPPQLTSAEVAGDLRKNGVGTSAEMADNKNRYKERDNKYLSEFGKFWEKYPRKEAKLDAEKAFKKIPLPELTSVMEGLESKINSQTWKDPKFIPLPSTWLNGRRWEDQPPSSAPPPSTRKVYWD